MAWTHELDPRDLALTLPDGSALVHADMFNEPFSYRMLVDGSVPWSFRWPQDPAPASFRLLSFHDETIAFWFASASGWDVRVFNREGVFQRRHRHQFDVGTQLHNGTNAAYVVDPESGAVQVVKLDGTLGDRATVSTIAALGNSSDPWFHTVPTAKGGEVIVGDDKITVVNGDGRVQSTFGWHASLGAAYGPQWGGVAMTTPSCELLMVEDGKLRWRADIHDDQPSPCDGAYEFASTASTLFVRTPNTRKGPVTLFAFDAAGRTTLRTEIHAALHPQSDDKGAFLRDCDEPETRHPIPPLGPPQAAQKRHARWATLEADIEQMLDIPVDAFVVSGVNDAALLSKGRLWRFDGKRWRDTGSVRAHAKKRRDKDFVYGAFEIVDLFGGRDELWVSMRSDAHAREYDNTPSIYLDGYHHAVARGSGGAFSELAATRPAFSRKHAYRSSAIPITHVLPGKETLVCHENWCQWASKGKATSVKMPKDWVTADVTWVGDEAWVLGPELARIDKNRAVTINVDTGVSGIPGLRPRLWGSSSSDVWWVAHAVHRHDGSRASKVEVPLVTPRDLGGAASNVWLAGDDGIAHYDGKSWARVAGAGRPKLAFVEAVGSDVWLAGASGVFRVRSQGKHEQKPAPKVDVRVSHAVREVAPTAASLSFKREKLSVRGRPKLVNAHEVVATPGGSVWLRDRHGVVSYDGKRAHPITARPGRWACRHCLAPTDGLHGYVLGTRVHTFGAAAPSSKRLTHMLGISVTPSAKPKIAGASDAPEAPSALWLEEDAYGWEVPKGCYAAIADRGDDTWLAGGLRCDHQDGTPWPAGEGVLIHRTPKRVVVHRAPDGPLLDVVAVDAGEAWAVGVAGAILHISPTGTERFQLKSRAHLHAVAHHDKTVWFAGDEATLVRRTSRFEHIKLPLPPRSTVLSLAFRGSELWVASADGLLSSVL